MPMRNILDAQTKRLVEIIEHLSSTPYSDTPSIMKLTNASDKTVINDLSFIENKWGKDLGMVKYKDVYYFEEKSSAIMHHIFKDLFSKSLPILLTMELFNHPNQGMKFYASNLHVSESSLYRLLPNLKAYLSKVNVKIETINGLYCLVSDNECHFRHFITALYLQTQFIDNLISYNEAKILNKVLNEFFTYYDPGSDKTGKDFYLLYYKFALRRELQGFKGSFSSDIALDFSYNLLSPYQDDLTKEHLKYAHGGFVKLFIPEKDSFEEIISLKTAVKKNLELNLNAEEEDVLYRLCADIYTYIHFYPFKVTSLFNRHQYFTQTFKKQKAKLYHLLRETVKEYADEDSAIFDIALEYFVYYLNIYFYDALRENRKFKVALVSEFGIEHAKFLQKYLLDHFSNLKIVIEDIYPLLDHEISDFLDINKYQLIISTGILTNLNRNQYLIISDYPNIRDLSRIKSRLQETDQSK